MQDQQPIAETLLVWLRNAALWWLPGPVDRRNGGRKQPIVPVIVRDYKRLFNLRPEHYQSTHKLNAAGIELRAMNVEPSTGSSFNAVAIPVNAEELEIVDQRERYYRRVTTPVHDFSTDEPLGLGHVYAADLASNWLDRDVRRLLPRWQDIVWARTGAYAISHAFGQYYDATTYFGGWRDAHDRFLPPASAERSGSGVALIREGHQSRNCGIGELSHVYQSGSHPADAAHPCACVPQLRE